MERPTRAEFADGELNLTLAPLSSPHRTHAASCSVSASTRRRPSSQDLACAFASQCFRRGVSGLLSPGSPVERGTTTAGAPGALIGAKTGQLALPMSGDLKLALLHRSGTCACVTAGSELDL